MSTGEIVIKLELDDKNFKGSISGAAGDVRRFEKAVKSSVPAVKGSEKHYRTWARTLRDSVIILGLARHAIENVTAVLFAFPNAVIKANAELERMTALMQGLSTESGGMAAAQADAQKNIAYLFDTAKRAPFEIGALTDSFVKMKSVGLDPLGGIFQGLVDSVAKFGGTPENLKRASIAIQQMAGKGVISMEELRQQLGESVPDAMAIMARSMGVGIGTLVEKVSTGTVEAKNALAAMARQMNIENAGAALRMSETWDGMINRMKTSLTLAAKEIGDAGFFDKVKSQLAFLVDDTLQDPRFFTFMRNLGEAMTKMVNGIEWVVTTLYRFKDAIADVTQALLAFWVVMKVKNNWGNIVAGVGKVNGGFVAMQTNLSALRNDYKRAQVQTEHFNRVTKVITANVQAKSVAMAQLSVVTNYATNAFRTFFSAIGGWTTVALVGIPAMIALFDRLQDKAVETAKAIDYSQPDFITEEQLNAIDATVEKYQQVEQEIENLARKIDEAKQRAARGGSFADATYKSYLGRMEQLKDQLKELGEALNGGLDSAFNVKALTEEAALKRALGQLKRIAVLDAEKNLRESVISYKRDLEALISDKKTMGQEEFRKARQEREQQFLNETKAYWDGLINAEVAAREKLLAEGKKLDDKEVAQQQVKIDALRAAQKESESRFDGTLFEIKSLTDEDANKKLTKLEQFLLSRQKMLAKYTAKTEDENPYLAEFEAMVDLGQFADATAQQLEKARQTMVELWKVRQAWDAQNADTQAFGDALGRIDQLTGQINAKFAQRENQNPLMRDTIEAEKLRAKLQEVGKEINSLSTIDQGARRDALEKLYQMGVKVEENARAATVAQIKSATQAMNRELLPEMQQIEAEYAELKRAAYEWAAAQGELSTEELRAFQNYISAINAQMDDQTQSPMQQLVEQWKTGTQEMKSLWTNTMESFVDTLADGFMEGKLEFNSFVEEFGRMVVKIQLQKMAAGIASGFGGFLGGGGGSLSSPVYTGAQGFANGGIMTPRGAVALQTYSNGGIANSPQLALYGEGRQPEAYVPLPDGRTIPVTVNSEGRGAPNMGGVQINMINQGGQPMEAEGGSPRFDGEKMVLDIVLKNAGRPGSFRSGLKSALSK